MEGDPLKRSRRLVVVILAASALGVALASQVATAAGAGSAVPVIKMPTSQFGNVLATRGKQALYYWNVEKKDYKVRCTGACARAWPPLYVRSRAAVPARIAGIKGKFGVIRRPDGRLQVTHNRLPIYTYAHEGPREVRCNNVNGWFVVRT